MMVMFHRHPPLPAVSELDDLRREASNLELERDALACELIQVAEELATVRRERDRLQVSVSETRDVLRATSYFEAAEEIPHLVEAVGLLAAVYEAERCRSCSTS